MSSYDKVVKLACKPKAAPPKAKYIDPIIAATWSDDGAVHDVCKALAPRLREPNAIVAFKALIVLHTMIRNGATDNVLSYLSSSEILRLRNITAGNWEGYAAPQNLQNYALYLDSRIRAYKDLKHDAVRVQAESNRDMRNSQSIEEDGYRGRKDRPIKTSASAPARSKTIMGRKLRSMTVEKGLLRETRAVHGMIDALVECRFYLDDLEDELTITALRMLVKDLLILFQAGNEGVINVLEHYFEMSHIDATEALKIYRNFCKQTEYVVEYLGVAKKLQNLLNVSIPNLKHAPVSLAGALQEYLDDANFEQNRIEYKTNKAATEGGPKSSANGKQTKAGEQSIDQILPIATINGKSAEASSSKAAPTVEVSKSGENKDVIDFFSSIDESQPTMFNPQTNSPSTAYFHQQASNPFGQMLTGQPMLQQPAQPLAFQPTGFVAPQQPNQPNPFANFLSPQVPQPTGHRPFSSYLPSHTTGFVPQQPTQQQQTQNPQQSNPLQTQQANFLQAQPHSQPQSQQSQSALFLSPQTQQPQQTNFLRPQQSGFLQPQATGANPFRQSMLIPQSTGMALFGGSSQTPSFGAPTFEMQSNPPSTLNTNSTTSAFSSLGSGPAASSSSFMAPKPSTFGTAGTNSTPARPASTPLTSTGSALSSTPQPVKTHQTGTKNPFGPITVPPPPVPKQPTLFELSSLSISNPNQVNFQPNQSSSQAQQQQPQATGFNFNTSALNPGASDISSVASSFAFSNSKPQTSTTSPPSITGSSATATGSTHMDTVFSSTLSAQPTGAMNSSTTPSMQPSASSLKPQMTGFSGLKPFKPSSSFGASLMESLPAIPGSVPTTPSVSGLPTTSGTTSPPNGSTFTSTVASPTNGITGNFAFLNTQPTGATGGLGGSFGSTLGVGLRPQMTGGGSANPFRASMATGGGNSGVSSFANFQPSPAINFGSSQPFNTGISGNQQQQPSSTNSLI
ncbi:ENTH domain-containing protein C19F8.03c [Psilocybe cubensis]|uniref:ENTH domain-containing protein C19F8.03c n=2 Tax=Psilocybe cubensis TaxID=181762 RepID=A0ACB8GVA6_PSICU|nr:ENTH domain-containing protein C19F8.03c [Psilocybe cubensis]KAH9479529.1 ENTH domain-containing protein C19F8.03c [Psilocybe cubensis]